MMDGTVREFYSMQTAQAFHARKEGSVLVYV